MASQAGKQSDEWIDRGLFPLISGTRNYIATYEILYVRIGWSHHKFPELMPASIHRIKFRYGVPLIEGTAVFALTLTPKRQKGMIDFQVAE